MKAISKTLGILGFALLMPLSAGAAMAAQAPQSPAANTTIQSIAPAANTGLVAKAAKPETIAVAGRRGRGLALGIIAGAAAAAIVTGAARSHGRRTYYREHRDYSPRPSYRRCERWAYRCDCGIRRACRKYYRYCE